MELTHHGLQIGLAVGDDFDNGRTVNDPACFDGMPDRVSPNPGLGGDKPVPAAHDDHLPFLQRLLSRLAQMSKKVPFHGPRCDRTEGASIRRTQQDHAGFHRADHATLEFEPACAERFDARRMGKPSPEARVLLASGLGNGGSKRLGRSPQRASFRFRLDVSIHRYCLSGYDYYDCAALPFIFGDLTSPESAQPAPRPCPSRRSGLHIVAPRNSAITRVVLRQRD